MSHQETAASNTVMQGLELKRTDLIVPGAWIGGRLCVAVPGKTFSDTNPANGEEIARLYDCEPADATRAADAAFAALPVWRGLLARERATLLMKWHGLLLENAEDLARLISVEQGKPLAESRGEVTYAAGFVQWFAEEAVRVYGETIPENAPGRRLLVVREPVGVVALVTPWNFPIAMLTRKLAPALAAGCTAVCKPAEETPLSAIAIAKLATEAGIPDGVVNVLPVSRERAGHLVDVWMDDARVRKLSFTGSTAVGKLLAEKCAKTLKRVSLELGGNAPLLVFDDADIEGAVQGTIAAKFRNAGQTCVCANRIFVQAGVYEAFAAKLALAVQALAVGAAGDGSVATIGPLINARAVEKVERHVLDAVGRGAHILIGGGRHAAGELFYTPTVLTDVDADMCVSRQETFGPVAPLIRFSTEAEAIQLANQSSAGLVAYLFSRDLGRVFRVATALETGMVGVNEGIISTEVAPFGGIKESGYGREGSRHGIDEYLNLKYICIGGLEG